MPVLILGVKSSSKAVVAFNNKVRIRAKYAILKEKFELILQPIRTNIKLNCNDYSLAMIARTLTFSMCLARNIR